MVAKVSAEHTSGDEGIEWIKNEPFDNTDGHLGTSAITGTVVPRSKGQYTLKRYLLRSKVPSLVAHLVPANALFLVEEAWNGYPHCKTVLVNGYMDKTRFRIVGHTRSRRRARNWPRRLCFRQTIVVSPLAVSLRMHFVYPRNFRMSRPCTLTITLRLRTCCRCPRRS